MKNIGKIFSGFDENKTRPVSDTSKSVPEDSSWEILSWTFAEFTRI